VHAETTVGLIKAAHEGGAAFGLTFAPAALGVASPPATTTNVRNKAADAAGDLETSSDFSNPLHVKRTGGSMETEQMNS
jgi:hypothetical protein